VFTWKDIYLRAILLNASDFILTKLYDLLTARFSELVKLNLLMVIWPLSTSALAASKNDGRFKSGQK